MLHAVIMLHNLRGFSVIPGSFYNIYFIFCFSQVLYLFYFLSSTNIGALQKISTLFQASLFEQLHVSLFK